ncbi:hypothetical protein [Fischerella sp. PCC 9605]|uniref:hypothetical protein n=1 Tax=Fischerella sp. PCC 9605 TaxID=1173024 RepID=UPI0012DFB8AE|nr:hypothetical protein [Fischerella sp. PCC 9605]
MNVLQANFFTQSFCANGFELFFNAIVNFRVDPAEDKTGNRSNFVNLLTFAF